MKFEWDDNKPQANLEKHKVDFPLAALIFLDLYRIEAIDNRKPYGEIRYQTIGCVKDIVLYVVYTLRGDVLRIISARRANKDEREKYFYTRASSERSE